MKQVVLELLSITKMVIGIGEGIDNLILTSFLTEPAAEQKHPFDLTLARAFILLYSNSFFLSLISRIVLCIYFIQFI